MKSKFTNEEKQAILERYISKSESPTSIINPSVFQKVPFTSGYRIIKVNKRKRNERA